jgi:hypothetical protein
MIPSDAVAQADGYRSGAGVAQAGVTAARRVAHLAGRVVERDALATCSDAVTGDPAGQDG